MIPRPLRGGGISAQCTFIAKKNFLYQKTFWKTNWANILLYLLQCLISHPPEDSQLRYTSTSTFTLGNSDHNLLIHLLDILHSYSLQQITYFLYARGHILFRCKLTHLVISRCGEKWGREEGGQEERTGIDAAQKYMFTFYLEVQIFIFLHFSKSLFLHRIFIILLEFYQHCVVTKRKSAIPRAEKFGRRQTVAAVAEAVVSREPSCRVMLIEGLTRVLQF